MKILQKLLYFVLFFSFVPISFSSLETQANVNELHESTLHSYLAETLQTDLNRQINLELESSYLYMGIATYFADSSLDGFAHWFRLQSDEERGHAKRIVDFLIDKRIPVALEPVQPGRYQVTSPLEAFEVGLQHEKMITSSIHGIYAAANGTNILDREVQVFLNWFVNEQVEEENMFQKVIDRLKIIGDSPEGLLLLDQELGRRTPPAP